MNQHFCCFSLASNEFSLFVVKLVGTFESFHPPATVRPVQPVEPVRLVEPGEPVEAVEPVKPIKPVEPVEPVEPVVVQKGSSMLFSNPPHFPPSVPKFPLNPPHVPPQVSPKPTPLQVSPSGTLKASFISTLGDPVL